MEEFDKRPAHILRQVNLLLVPTPDPFPLEYVLPSRPRQYTHQVSSMMHGGAPVAEHSSPASLILFIGCRSEREGVKEVWGVLIIKI